MFAKVRDGAQAAVHLMRPCPIKSKPVQIKHRFRTLGIGDLKPGVQQCVIAAGTVRDTVWQALACRFVPLARSSGRM